MTDAELRMTGGDRSALENVAAQLTSAARKLAESEDMEVQRASIDIGRAAEHLVELAVVDPEDADG